MRVADSLLALPFMVVAIAIHRRVGAGRTQLIVLLTAFVGCLSPAWCAPKCSPHARRKCRGGTLHRRRGLRVALSHILPNVLSPVIVLSTFSVASMIVAESALSFLGLGVPPPAPTWGSMLAEGRGYLDTAWWLSVFPGLAITLTVMGSTSWVTPCATCSTRVSACNRPLPASQKGVCDLAVLFPERASVQLMRSSRLRMRIRVRSAPLPRCR